MMLWIKVINFLFFVDDIRTSSGIVCSVTCTAESHSTALGITLFSMFSYSGLGHPSVSLGEGVCEEYKI